MVLPAIINFIISFCGRGLPSGPAGSGIHIGPCGNEREMFAETLAAVPQTQYDIVRLTNTVNNSSSTILSYWLADQLQWCIITALYGLRWSCALSDKCSRANSGAHGAGLMYIWHNIAMALVQLCRAFYTNCLSLSRLSDPRKLWFFMIFQTHQSLVLVALRRQAIEESSLPAHCPKARSSAPIPRYAKVHRQTILASLLVM